MRESVTAVFQFENEIFIINRQNYLSVFPGYTSFPGGKVDDSDAEDPFIFEIDSNKRGHGLMREIQEEINISLLSIKDRIKSFSLLGVATTPAFNHYRFKNYFYKIELSEKINFNVDSKEIKSASWQSLENVYSLYKKGELLVVHSTLSLIKQLKENPKLKENLSLDLLYDEEKEVPMIETVSGVKQYLPKSNTFPPASRTNCFLLGDFDSQQILIDPSPKDENELENFYRTLEAQKIDEIFLTHHHIDHHQHSPLMAREWNIPMSMSKDTHERILSKRGNDYFSGIKIQFKKQGDVLTQSNKKDVVLYAVPGHDEGQLAPARLDHAWIIVGDLIQTIGTVVVGGEESNMIKYFSSLEKMIALEPRVVFPSHGMALGGVEKLKKTLKHRKRREDQIKELLAQGKTKEDIFKIIYRGLEERLHKYALATLEAHLKKIHLES